MGLFKAGFVWNRMCVCTFESSASDSRKSKHLERLKTKRNRPHSLKKKNLNGVKVGEKIQVRRWSDKELVHSRVKEKERSIGEGGKH